MRKDIGAALVVLFNTIGGDEKSLPSSGHLFGLDNRAVCCLPMKTDDFALENIKMQT